MRTSIITRSGGSAPADARPSPTLAATRVRCPSDSKNRRSAWATDTSSSITRISAIALCHWQDDSRTRAARLTNRQRDAAAMPLDHGPGVDQAKTDAFRLGGHERIEHAIGNRRIDADAVVCDIEGDAAGVVSGDDRQRAAVWHGVNRIDDHVEQCLGETLGVEPDARQPVGQPPPLLDLPVPQAAFERRGYGTDYGVEIRGGGAQLAGTSQLDQIANHGFDLADIVPHGRHAPRVRLVAADGALEQLRVDFHRREWIANVVRHARSNQAGEPQFFGSHQRRLRVVEAIEHLVERSAERADFILALGGAAAG